MPISAACTETICSSRRSINESRTTISRHTGEHNSACLNADRETKAGSAQPNTKVGTATSLSFVDKTAKKGTTYYYTVKAVNGTVYSANDPTGLKVTRK